MKCFKWRHEVRRQKGRASEICKDTKTRMLKCCNPKTGIRSTGNAVKVTTPTMTSRTNQWRGSRKERSFRATGTCASQRRRCFKRGTAALGNKSYPCIRPWRPLRLWDVQAPTFSTKSVNRWQSGCRLHAPATLHCPETFLVLMSVHITARGPLPEVN
jgi:hypothetical protein